ncbi:MurR/RpiR family transcriptional regulator [Paracoccus liaowanqingii]|uniref:MurR/RpiR family transcriptional regulator n=1 Tax=Paracoccus liaowanqingii TaxID=2560053 RepID=A0A4Z1CRP3_9RHOB|nr:MurR/RpiR family transcriptional regulator [Paracoccus liaowanqingii]TGN67943.1 MurR/RpiR family transcriptional regulator [Paracoccus liaowanqingii]
MEQDQTAAGIIARIQALSGRLTQTEQRLVTELLAAPRDVALGSSADFAARASAHEATTSRFARKLGFASYSAFRTALQREWLQKPDPAARMSATLSQSDGRIIDRLVAGESAGLAAIADYLTERDLAEAAALIDRPRLFVFAQGNASVLAAMMERRLRRMGILPILMTGSARDIAEQAVTIAAGDTVFLLAFRRQPRLYASLMESVQLQGATTLALSDALGPSLNPAPDRLLSVPRQGGDAAFQTLTVPMLICNALILALGARREGAMAVLTRLGTLIERFEGNNSAH